MGRPTPSSENPKLSADAKIAIVAARYNARNVDVLLDGRLDRLGEAGADGSCIVVQRVPGAFELLLTAKCLADSKIFAAVVFFGCVICSNTFYFEFVAGDAAVEVILPQRSVSA